MAQLGSPMCDSPTSFSESLYLQYDRQQSHLSTPNLNCAAVAAVAAAESFFSVSAQDHEPRIITIPQKAMRPDTMTTNTYTSSTSSDDWMRWTIILVMLALVLSTIVLGQVVATYSSAYLAAPREVATIIDTVDFSIQENESYDRDVNKVQRLEDKLRLGRLLREIQKTGDDLREELNSLLIDNDTTTLRLSARAMWASRRVQLESAVRRLDLLRMRFLVVYMGIMTSIADKQPPAPPPLPPSADRLAAFKTPTKLKLKKSFADDHPKLKVPSRRLTTQAVGHHEHVAGHSRMGWAGVVQELQLSPKLQQRHASIEQHMATEKMP